MDKRILIKATRIAANVGEVHIWRDGRKRKKTADGKWVLVTDPKPKQATPDVSGIPNKIRVAHTASPHTKKVEDTAATKESKSTAESLRSIVSAQIPTNATNVKYNLSNTDTRPSATWTNSNGTQSGAYTTAFVKNYKGAQWGRIQKNADNLEQAPEKLQEIYTDERRPIKQRDAAAIASIVMATGLSGGAINTNNPSQSYGIAGLMANDVSINDDRNKADISVRTKDGRKHTGTIADEEIALYLVEKLETADQRAGFMFDYDKSILAAVMDDADIGDLSLADLAATTNANLVAVQLDGVQAPQGFGASPGITFEFIKNNVEKIQSRLGTQAPAGMSHVPPNVIAAWSVDNGLDKRHAADIQKADKPQSSGHFNRLFRAALDMGGTYATGIVDAKPIPDDEADPPDVLLCYPIPDVILNNSSGEEELEDSDDAIEDMQKSLSIIFDLMKGIQPPPGYQPTPSGHGYRKRVGDHWDYWYPSAEHASRAAEYHETNANLMRQKLGSILRSKGAKQADIERFLNSWIGHENAAHTFKRHASAMKDASIAAPDIQQGITSRVSSHPDGGGQLFRNGNSYYVPAKATGNVSIRVPSQQAANNNDVPYAEDVLDTAAQQAANAANRAASPGQNDSNVSSSAPTPTQISGISPEVIDAPNPEEVAKTFAEAERVRASNIKVQSSFAKQGKVIDRIITASGLGMPNVRGMDYDTLMRSSHFREYEKNARNVGVNREQVKEIFAHAYLNENKPPEARMGMDYIQVQSQIRAVLGDGSSEGWKRHAMQYGDSINNEAFKRWSKEQMKYGATYDETKTKWRGFMAIAMEEPHAVMSGLVNDRINEMVRNESRVFGKSPMVDLPTSISASRPISERFTLKSSTRPSTAPQTAPTTTTESTPAEPKETPSEVSQNAQESAAPSTKQETVKMPPTKVRKQSIRVDLQREKIGRGSKERLRDMGGSLGIFNTKTVPRKVKNPKKVEKEN